MGDNLKQKWKTISTKMENSFFFKWKMTPPPKKWKTTSNKKTEDDLKKKNDIKKIK
jgi:hypothetical protein